MKYIRTTDGRISYLSQEPYEDMDCYEIITSKGLITYRSEDEVVKIADTIEGLCDEFVFHDMTLGSVGMFTIFSKPLPLQKKFKINVDYEQFGAIWTPQGLIFKAKMKGILPNGKIDWELL